MTGLLLKDLKARGLVQRTLIVTPANLSFQWQREMKDKFRENFEVICSDVLRANYGQNPWQDRSQVVQARGYVVECVDSEDRGFDVISRKPHPAGISMHRIALFAEDVAHEAFLTAVVRRYAGERKVEAEVRPIHAIR